MGNTSNKKYQQIKNTFMSYKKLPFPILYLLLILGMNSCSSVKNMSYFQKFDNKNNTSKKVKDNISFYETRIKPKDILSITVVTSEPEASKHYNLTVPQVADLNTINNIYSQPTLQTYLVNNEGIIDFPVFGKIKISGLTSKELEIMLQKKMESEFNKEHPIITIRFINYSVNILGEVTTPGRYETGNERLTIFEGLALAGDLTVYGMRQNVKILRENADGSKVFINVNLNDENIINSTGYYLEQNDVVYVEPNKAKAKNSKIGSAENLGISAMYLAISLASLVVTLLRF
jgi:polysaccharide export outer membrane protein